MNDTRNSGMTARWTGTIALVLGLGLPLFATAAPNDDFLPQNYSPSRYSSTWGASPFNREVLPPAKVAEEVVSPFEGLSVAGYYKVGEKYRVTLVDKKNQKKFVTSDPADSDDGMHVIGVTRGARPSATTIRLRRGTEEDDVGFDQKRVTAAPKGLPIQQKKAVPTNRGGAVQPGAANTTRRTGVVVPRNPKVPNPANAAINPAGARAQGAAATPQAAAAKQQAQQANQQLIEHLRAAAARSNTQATGTQSNRPQRRRVVLPPSVGNR